MTPRRAGTGARDNRREAALGLATRCDAAELYQSLSLADPFVAVRESFSGTVVSGVVSALPAKGSIVLTLDLLLCRLRQDTEVEGYPTFPRAARTGLKQEQRMRLRERIAATQVTGDGRLVVTIEEVVVRQGAVRLGQRLTLRPRSIDPQQQQSARQELHRRYATRHSWLAGGPAPTPRRRDVPLEVVIAAPGRLPGHRCLSPGLPGRLVRTLPQSSRSGSPIAVATAPPPVAAHQHDPILAAALFSAWSGDPAVVVASPPGAGKTRLVVHLAEQLHRRAGLSVAIAAQTRAQALDVTNRAAALGASVALLGGHKSSRPLGLDPTARYLEGAAYLSRWRGVAVATTARWLWVPERQYTADVCIVDFSSRPHHVFDVGSHLRSGCVAYVHPSAVRHTTTGPQGAYGAFGRARLEEAERGRWHEPPSASKSSCYWRAESLLRKEIDNPL